jgi:hypothetical protein
MKKMSCDGKADMAPYSPVLGDIHPWVDQGHHTPRKATLIFHLSI